VKGDGRNRGDRGWVGGKGRGGVGGVWGGRAATKKASPPTTTDGMHREELPR